MRIRVSLLASCVALLTGLLVSGPGQAGAQGPIKIGFVQGLTGPFEVYAKQEVNGFKLGLEYATGGKMEVLGRKIEVIVEDDQLKPDVSKQKVTKLYADDQVHLVVGVQLGDLLLGDVGLELIVTKLYADDKVDLVVGT